MVVMMTFSEDEYCILYTIHYQSLTSILSKYSRTMLHNWSTPLTVTFCEVVRLDQNANYPGFLPHFWAMAPSIQRGRRLDS